MKICVSNKNNFVKDFLIFHLAKAFRWLKYFTFQEPINHTKKNIHKFQILEFKFFKNSKYETWYQIFSSPLPHLDFTLPMMINWYKVKRVIYLNFI